VIEEFVLVDGPVLHVVPVAEIVGLAVVHEHVRFFPQPPQRAEELDALISSACAVIPYASH
jgi:hypothetical protein